jgi:hypothetical protein
VRTLPNGLRPWKKSFKSMSSNDVWDLVDNPNGVKPVGCKWVYKTKRDSKGNVE